MVSTSSRTLRDVTPPDSSLGKILIKLIKRVRIKREIGFFIYGKVVEHPIGGRLATIQDSAAPKA